MKRKVQDVLWDIKWKYSIKDWVWRKHTKALFQPSKQFTAKFWKWLYNRLRGNFTVNTKYGSFGVNWYGFFNFDIDFGAFCQITIFCCKGLKTFLVKFLRRYYKNSFLVKGKGRPYFAYIFGHELKSDYIGNKFVYYSAWHWGKYLPQAPDVNIRKTGKLFGIIGYGKAKKEEPLFDEFKTPPFSWITPEYVEQNGWAVCSCDKDRICPGGKCKYVVSKDKVIPCFPKRFLKPGDVMIYFDYEKGERFEKVDGLSVFGKSISVIIDHGEEFEEADRYLVITEEFLEQWEEEELGCPDAVVVRTPDLPGPKKENAIIKFFKKALNKITLSFFDRLEKQNKI